MTRVTLESATEVLDLNSISVDGEGVEAIAGLTGFGLPPVEVQWTEGAGDGARFRSSRVLPREVDIPLHVYHNTRAELKATIAKISRVMAGKMVCKVYDPETGTYVTTDFYRTGGGDYGYGTDSNGMYEWNGVVTLRTGAPYWSHQSVSNTNIIAAAGTVTDSSLVINNAGSAPVPPKVTVTGGPTVVQLTLGTETVRWTGSIGSNTLVIDMATGEVTSGNGLVNYYSGVQAPPQFFSLTPGDNNVSVHIEWATDRTAGADVGDISFTPRDWMVI